MQSVLKLTDAEIDNITRFERGSALIVTNSNNVTVDMRCSEEEKDLITTDRDELRRIVETQNAKSNRNGGNPNEETCYRRPVLLSGTGHRHRSLCRGTHTHPCPRSWLNCRQKILRRSFTPDSISWQEDGRPAAGRQTVQRTLRHGRCRPDRKRYAVGRLRLHLMGCHAVCGGRCDRGERGHAGF